MVQFIARVWSTKFFLVIVSSGNNTPKTTIH